MPAQEFKDTTEIDLIRNKMNMPLSEMLDNDCLGELEDLLVPVTVLSTHEDDSKSNGNEFNVEQSTSVVIKVEKVRKPKKHVSRVTSASLKQERGGVVLLNSAIIGGTVALNQDNEEEDDEEDEFEDEGELEVGNSILGMRSDLERRLLPPVIMPMPVMKRASLCLQEKITIIKELEGGEKQSWICKKKRLPKSTVQSIWKNRLKILEATEKIGLGRKRCRRAQHENIEDKLVEWIDTLKSQNVPVNGPQLRAKAQVFAKQLGILDFKSSTGWLDKFKTRHDITFKKSIKTNNGTNCAGSGAGSGDKKVAIDWVTKIWPNMCEGYTPENIFNADEFGLFFSALPDQTSKLLNETCQSGKMASERLTVLICANSDGSEKRPLTVVGNHNLVGSINTNNLPASYYADSKSWMSRYIFIQELRRWDEQLRACCRNILIILDNSPAHTVTESFSNIKLVFLPPIVASILQPLEHGIFQLIKSQYRRLLLDKVTRSFQQIQVQDQGQGSKSSDFSAVSILDAIVMLDCAWASVSPEAILECFKTSNLQSMSISVSSSSSSSSSQNKGTSASNELDTLLDLELMERAATFIPNIQIPSSINLPSYAGIDGKLHVTDYINDEHQFKSSAADTMDQNVSSGETPCKTQVQSYLTSIRNWAMSLPVDIDDPRIHESISILENFAMKQPNDYEGQGQGRLGPGLGSGQGTNNSHSSTSNSTNPSLHGQLSVNRLLLNGTLNNNLSLSHPQPPILTMPTTQCTSTNPSSNNPTTVVTFTLSDSLQQSNLSQNLMDQQQFFAYLT